MVRASLKALTGDLYFETKTVADLDDLLTQLSFAPDDLLVINGGDGTVQTVLSALLRRKGRDTSKSIPCFVLLPAGSTNLSALDLHGQINLKNALAQLTRRVKTETHAQSVSARSLIRVQIDGRPDQFGFVFGFGAIAQGVKYFQRHTRTMRVRQEWAAGLAALRAGIGIIRNENQFIEPSPVCIHSDSPDNALLNQSDCILALASTLDRTILRFHYHWGKGNGCIRFTAFDNKPPKLIRALVGIIRGKVPQWVKTSNKYHSYRFDKADLQFSGDFILDGEIMAASQNIHLSSSQALNFIKLSDN